MALKSQEQVLKLIQEKERIEKEIQNHGVVLKNVNFEIFIFKKETIWVNNAFN